MTLEHTVAQRPFFGPFYAIAVAFLVLSTPPILASNSTGAGQKETKAEPQSATTWQDPAQNLSVSFEGVDDWKAVRSEPRGQSQAAWSGQIGKTQLSISLVYLDKKRFGFNEPKDVLDSIEYNLPGPKGSDPDTPGLTEYLEFSHAAGSYGYVPVAWLGIHAELAGTRKVNHRLDLCGLTESVGYSLQVRCKPALTDGDRKAITEWLWNSVSYDGPTRVAEWTDEEAEARWKRDAPEKVQEKSKFRMVRTKHYLILTNVGKGTVKSFAEKLDENYEIIREVYPFEDMPAQRLLPVFYFVTPDQYHAWCQRVLNRPMTTSAGVAFGDVYATYHQSSGAPVHIHEATHQIFKNRLFLGGGGSWFQEGVAEYMSARPGDLNSVKSLVKRDKHKRFRHFFKMGSLLGDADTNRVSGGSDSGESYAQAAAIIEFVRHSEFGGEKFLDFIHAVGKVPRSNLLEIEKAIQAVYGVDITGFESEFKDYWESRKRRKKIKKKRKK